MADVLDYQLQHTLKHIIQTRASYSEKIQLRNIYNCGKKIAHNVAWVDKVFLTKKDNGQASFVGQSHCKNPFCCPVCSAKIMEVYRSKIASALDMYEGKFFAFMVTFTIPHLKFMNCKETTDILYDTWKYFHQKNFKKDFHVFQQFAESVNIKHWVRVCEYTYGDNGWHPHFHCIFWVDRKNKDQVLDFEKSLNDFWMKQAKRCTLKYWQKNGLHSTADLEKLLQRVYAYEDSEKGFVISQKNGKICESKASDYLAGWTADKELTGGYSRKTAREGHYTPYQILQKAAYDEEFQDIYFDYCLSVTRKPVHHRLNFSKSGILKEIYIYRQKQGYESVIMQKKSRVNVVSYFTKNEWLELLMINEKIPVLSNILYLTEQDDFTLLKDYLHSLNIPYRPRADNTEFYAFVESILNGTPDKCTIYQQIQEILNDIA